jgi:hypothetical protein
MRPRIAGVFARSTFVPTVTDQHCHLLPRAKRLRAGMPAIRHRASFGVRAHV